MGGAGGQGGAPQAPPGPAVKAGPTGSGPGQSTNGSTGAAVTRSVR